MLHTPQQILTQLAQKQYAPLYFLQGEEPYYINLITDYIEKHVLTDAEKGFNLTIMYGKETDLPTILSQARRYPMGSEHQVVLVKEAQELRDLNREEGKKLLTAYIQSPNPATLLVFAHKYKVLDGRRALSQLLAKQAVLVNSKKLYENQLSAWITSYVHERKMRITEKAIWMLQEHIGNDLERLANELRKVIINMTETDLIDDVMVQAYVGISRTYNVFELQRALAKNDISKAQQIALHFAANAKHGSAIPLVALLFSFFSKLLRLHHASDRSDAALSKALQVSPYFVREYAMAAKHYSLSKVLENIHCLHQADLQLKGIGYPATQDGEILRELIFKIL